VSSLAEFARQERLRREAQGEIASRVITADNVPRGGIPNVVGRVDEVGPAAGEAEPEAIAVDIDDAAAAIAEQQRVVRGLEDQEVLLQLEINRHRGEYMAPVVSQAERNRALESMNRAEANLEALRAELAEARETLLALEQAPASNP
jgi:hypothetical protein